jgi:transposase InsO family protein
VVPAFQKAGWQVQRLLTDQGNEFRGRFDQACSERGIRHTRTQPRHAWTTGFVERLHGTILQELGRIEFRRRFSTRTSQTQVALDRCLEFYNHRHAHQGYRTRGRTPGNSLMRRRSHGNHPTKA